MILKLKKSILRSNIATLSFLLLFPGFFFYHFAIGKGLIPPFLGGYFGIVSALLLIPLLLLNYRLFLKQTELPVLCFFLILILTFVTSIYYYVTGSPRGYVTDMLVWSLSGLLFNVVAFMLAYGTNIGAIAKYGYWLIVLMFLLVIFNIGDSGIFYIKLDAGEAADSVATYQGFARSIVVTLLVSSAIFFQKGKSFYVLLLVGIIALFFNGARTEFAIFLVSMFFFYFYYSMGNIRTLMSLVVLLTILTTIAANIIELIPVSRMLQLVDIGSSSSGESRDKILSFGIELISNNPVFGDYAGYATAGGIGYYPHNIISAWLNLGVVGFSLYILMFVLLWKDIFKNFLKDRDEKTYKVFFIFLLFTTGSLIVSKDYSYLLIGLLLGFYLRYKTNLKR